MLYVLNLFVLQECQSVLGTLTGRLVSLASTAPSFFKKVFGLQVAQFSVMSQDILTLAAHDTNGRFRLSHLIVHAINSHVSLSKGFPDSASLGATGCLPLFLRALELFSSLATAQVAAQTLRNGLRTLVVCLLFVCCCCCGGGDDDKNLCGF
jgi:hypothetical protein